MTNNKIIISFLDSFLEQVIIFVRLSRAMKEEQFYQNIQNALENLPENFSVLEERIEIEVQMKYFEFSKNIRGKNIAAECFENREQLLDSEVDIERKKEILSAIATVDDVKAYRAIEAFVKNNEGDIKQWAVLAFQESRMLIQSSLLEEQQVFISTGLGGKGKKLRYYVVFINNFRNEILNNTQQKLLREELIYELNGSQGEFESMDFMEGFSTALVMLPLNSDIKKVFQNVVDECNQYGDFLNEDMIVTNVKVLSRGEIIQLLHQNKNQELSDFEED